MLAGILEKEGTDEPTLGLSGADCSIVRTQIADSPRRDASCRNIGSAAAPPYAAMAVFSGSQHGTPLAGEGSQHDRALVLSEMCVWGHQE